METFSIIDTEIQGRLDVLETVTHFAPRSYVVDACVCIQKHVRSRRAIRDIGAYGHGAMAHRVRDRPTCTTSDTTAARLPCDAVQPAFGTGPRCTNHSTRILQLLHIQ